ncbi:lipid II flippase Amj family protein [Desulforamulus ruminis]|uniref:Lipid II flippase Amj n=1 Tax=Desulforamulus ruminis (strain ATCC 23193 / DSM 2154 / NCIMB 8452 / DL) TaxID=696281 RepID=F6DV15_DESRL|nr:lipid II flippase Amj family protein [Desulforamulus ruminis]AEG61412.1 hypothetical protein Desru_3203 [Desulforamulus ruminis DSM 2154]
MKACLYELMVLTFIIHLIDTLSYSVRLNSVRSGQFALSMSFFNLFVLVSRTANTFQAPLIGSLIGISITSGIEPSLELRKIIFSSTIGTLVAIFLIPWFLRIFSAAVKRLDLQGSVLSVLVEAFSLSTMKQLIRKAVKPSRSMISTIRFNNIPKRLLILNTVITGIYTIGVLSANYSAMFVAEQDRLAAASSAGMINGIATIMLTLFIDPKAAIITDQALKGDRPYNDVKALVTLLIGTKLLGTILGQFLFLPAAKLIAYFYNS